MSQAISRQSKFAMNADIATNDNQLKEPRIELQCVKGKSGAARNSHEFKPILHYTHEKRLESLKREMHWIYSNVFENLSAEEMAMIVGTHSQRL